MLVSFGPFKLHVHVILHFHREFSSSPQTARRKHAKTSVTVSNREASKINIRS